MTAVTSTKHTAAPAAAPGWLRPHQQRARADVLGHFAGGAARATVVLPCGTGKTRLGAALAMDLAQRRVLVLVPSLALVEQTLREWDALPGLDLDPVVVCSDPSTAAGAAERNDQDRSQPRLAWHARQVPVSTNPDRVARLLSRGARHGRQVVFSTYHSLPVLATAIGYAAEPVRFDLVLADEAHRLGGNPSAAFRLALDERALPADHRVFLTATPVVADGEQTLSMDNPHHFGPVVHRLSFGEAIDQGLLSDYRVLVVAERLGHAGDADPVELAAVAALRTAAQQHRLSRVLTFHGRVRAAERFTGLLHQGGDLPDGRAVWARMVDSTLTATQRRDTLTAMDRAGQQQLAVVSNARCLGEGVDLPAVDGLVFCSPKHSVVDIVQAVGRVLRRAPGKDVGTVVIPVALPEDGPLTDDDSDLLASRFGHVWSVLRALRAHDERLGRELDSIACHGARRGRMTGERTVERVSWLLPEGMRTEAQVRLVRELASPWETAFGLLLRHVDEHGSAAVPSRHRSGNGFALGEWVARQRVARRHGLLPAERTERLQRLPGWAWSLTDQHHAANVAALRSGPRLPGGRLDLDALSARAACGRAHPTLGVFAAAQRAAYRAGELTPAQVAELESVPGWTWQALSHDDVAMVDLLADYVAWEKDANVPADYVEGRVPLGAWLAGVRRRKLSGTAPAVLLDEVAAVTPPRYAAGALRWDRREAQWGAGLEAATRFAAREGHLRVPQDHVEMVDGNAVALQRWIVARRHEHRAGTLAADRAARLAAIRGWRWEVAADPRVRRDIGETPHGTRTGYVKKCRCPECTAAHLAYNREHERRARAGESTSTYVDARPARLHLLALLRAGAGVKAMQRVSGVRRNVLRALADGQSARIHPRTAQRVLDLTLEQVRASVAPGTHVDAQATWEVLDRLIDAGWPRAWIARELNGPGSAALQLGRDSVTAASAAKVAALAERIGDRQPPPRRPRQPLPTLAEIEAAERTRSAGAA